MPEPTDKPSSTEPPPSASGDPRVSRRRLLQGALASAPVLMTLVSRPVLAQSTCTTPSGFVSANASHPGAAHCSGNGPKYWYDHQSAWPHDYNPHGKHFKHYFDPDLSGNPKLTEVLNPAGGYNDVARYLVAALLNIGPPVLTPVLLYPYPLKHIWSEFAASGHFSPSSGASWDASEIVNYLQSTMTTA